MKKLISLLLILVLALGLLSVPAVAATPKITGLSPAGADLGDIYMLSPDDLRPGYKHVFVIDDVLSYFEMEGTVPATDAALLRLLKTVDIRSRVRSGPNIIKSVKWLNAVIDPDDNPFGAATIEMELINPYVGVDDIEAYFVLYFLINNKRTDGDLRFNFDIVFGNEVTEVDDDTYDVDTYQGQVAKAIEYVSDIALVGNYEFDIRAHVRMPKDRKIYFYVTTEGELSDEPIFDKYPSIEYAFKVRQVNLSSYSGNFIELGGVDSAYYVYGKNADGSLRYLGRGGELLPFSEKYYVATQKLDIDGPAAEALPEEDSIPVPSAPEYNPSTGI